MKIITFFSVFLIVQLCNNVPIDQQGDQDFDTKIRVVNSSKYNCTNVSLFSIAFENLKPGDTSEYKVLNYNYLKDEPLIYVTVEDKTLGLYLKIIEETKKLTYVIDSINIPHGMIYLSNN